MEEGITRVNATRRRYSAAFKAQVLRECGESGASVAATALSHGINANIVHKWRLKARRGALGCAAPAGFIPLALQRPGPLQASPAPGVTGQQPAEPIEISVQRGAVHARVAWPVQAAGDCAAWLAELLR